MEKNQIDSELKITESPETLWENFEKTGSVTAFLKYAEKVKNSQEIASFRLPS
jgi:hypothetical protein